MSYLRTSISIIALATNLTVCLAPKIALADNAPAGPSMGGFASPDSSIGQQEKHLDDINKTGEKLKQPEPKKPESKPQPTAQTNPEPKVDPKSEGTSTASWCWNGVCSAFKAATGIGTAEVIYDAVTKPAKESDEAAEYERHKEDVRKEVEKKQKAEAEQKKAAEQQKTVAPKSSDVKSAEVKTVETKGSKSVVVSSAKPATKVVPFDAPKTMTPTVTRPTVTTVSHMEVKPPALNIVRPTVNVPHPVVNVPHPTIRIPTIVAHR